MKSMTGFGRGRVWVGDWSGRNADGGGEGRNDDRAQGSIMVEIRSTNHRYLDIRVMGDDVLGEMGSELEQHARRYFFRGHWEIVVRAEGMQWQTPQLDTVRAKAVFASLVKLRDEIAPGEPVPFSMLALVPNIFSSGADVCRETLFDAVKRAFDQAVKAADQMREREGKALRADLLLRTEVIRRHCALINDMREQTVETYRKRIQEQIKRLVTGTEPIDSMRVEQEVALLAERCDSTEELTRISSHIAQIEHLSNLDEPVGRRLDFLLQEIVREINTVGAKSQNATISHRVVEIKAQVDRMREQVQNVE